MAHRELKIAIWNLDRPSPSKKPKKNSKILETLSELDADILVLTETNSCIDLNEKYQTCFATTCLFQSLAIGSEQYQPGENRVTIWSKFPGQRRIDMCNSHSGICALLKCDDWGELNVYGTILGIYGKNRGRYEPDLGRTDFQTAIEVQTIDWERLEGLGNLCIAGDFNTAFRGRYSTKESREKLDLCFRNLNIVVPTRDIEENIDHIALSESFLNSVTWETDWQKDRDDTISDHMWVSLTLKRIDQPLS